MRLKIVYLHGWLGKGVEHKAQAIQHMFPKSELIAPTLPEDPQKAIEIIDNLMLSLDKDWDVLIVGHCLGGYYAKYVGAKYKRPTILLNPIVDPEYMSIFLGRNTNRSTGNIHNLMYQDIDTLKKCDIIGDYSETLVLLNSGDEIVDYHNTVNKFGESNCVVFDGGNHSFVGLTKAKPFIENHVNSCLGVFY